MRYRLLRKLFDIEPQTFHTVTDNRDEDGCVWLGFEEVYRDNILVPKVLIDNPDWFAPVVEDRRKYIIQLFKDYTTDPVSVMDAGELTPEAATAVADAIKALLEYVNEPYANDAIGVNYSEMLTKLVKAENAARYAVQQGGDNA